MRATPISGAVSGGGAPTDAHYLTDQAEAGLSAEVVVSANGKSIVTAVDYAAMRTLLNVADTWRQLIAGTDFTATPASTSTITMLTDQTANVLAGMSLKYKISGTYYYGRVSAITSNLLTVNGISLSGTIQELWYDGGKITQMVIGIPGYYEDASNTTLMLSDLGIKFTWKKPKSYLVYYSKYSVTHDSGTHGKATIYVNGADVNTSAGGLEIAADATEYGTGVDINTSNYDINPGEALEIASTKGGNGDAKDLTSTIIFVTP